MAIINTTSIGTVVSAKFNEFNDTPRKLEGFAVEKIFVPDEVTLAVVEKTADDKTVVYAVPPMAALTLSFTHGSTGAQLLDQVAQSSLTNQSPYECEITIITQAKKYVYTEGAMTSFTLSSAEKQMGAGEYKLTFGKLAITDL